MVKRQSPPNCSRRHRITLLFKEASESFFGSFIWKGHCHIFRSIALVWKRPEMAWTTLENHLLKTTCWTTVEPMAGSRNSRWAACLQQVQQQGHGREQHWQNAVLEVKPRVRPLAKRDRTNFTMVPVFLSICTFQMNKNSGTVQKSDLIWSAWMSKIRNPRCKGTLKVSYHAGSRGPDVQVPRASWARPKSCDSAWKLWPLHPLGPRASKMRASTASTSRSGEWNSRNTQTQMKPSVSMVPVGKNGKSTVRDLQPYRGMA